MKENRRQRKRKKRIPTKAGPTIPWSKTKPLQKSNSNLNQQLIARDFESRMQIQTRTDLKSYTNYIGIKRSLYTKT